MLDTISLKFSECQQPLKMDAQGVTIFVGPNNSGKSLVLRELEAALIATGNITTKILNDFEIAWPTEAQIEEDIALLKLKQPSGMVAEHIYIGRFAPSGNREAQEINQQSLLQVVRNKNKHWLTSQFLRFFLIRLDGRTRFDLTTDRAAGDLLGIPQNILAHLFQDDTLRKEIRNIVYDAFGVYFVIDPLNGGNLRIRLSPTEPTHDEQSLNKEARDVHQKATYIKDASDGVQAFVGILTAVRSGDYRTVLIDEPEAFLHPPLARKLGYELASIITKKGSGSLMASTHSSDFLMGCLQASPNVKVVRLEYSNEKSKGQIVDATALSKLLRTPLMRSANVISALFHDGVVVTESDNDRVFYSEIYHRLTEQEKGLPSVLFVNAQNKQTIRDIIGPLRAFGVPAAAIVDIDILKDGGTTWTGWLQAALVPAALHGGLGQVRGDLKKRFDDGRIDMKADGGANALTGPDKEAATQLFETLDQYGVFVTRNGELEHWLKGLQVPGKKTDWTIAMLERLGADPRVASYVRQSDNDVWVFMRNILGWIKNPARRGTI